MTILSVIFLVPNLYAALVAANLVTAPADSSVTIEIEDSLAGQSCLDSEAALLTLRLKQSAVHWYDVGTQLRRPVGGAYQAWFLIGGGQGVERHIVVLEAGTYDYTISSRATRRNGATTTIGSSPESAGPLVLRAGDRNRILLLKSLTGKCDEGKYDIVLCEGDGCRSAPAAGLPPARRAQ